MVGAADVGIKRRGGDGEDTSEEISGPAVAAGGRGGVWPVGADHVVNGGHVNAVVCDADDGGEDGGADPVDGRAAARPGEADQTDGEARGRVEEEPEAGFVLGFFVVGIIVAFLDVAADGGDEEGPGDEVADQDGQEGEALGDDAEVPLGVDEAEGLDEHEDEGVAEAGEEGERQDDGFGEEHLERSDPGDEDFFDGEAFPEGGEFVGSPDVLSFLAPLLGNVIQHNRRPRLGHEDKV